MNDIYSTADGINWHKIETKGDVFSPRELFGTAVFGNKMYVLGGQTENGLSNTIYSTADGKYWDQICLEGLYNVDNKCVDENTCKYI